MLNLLAWYLTVTLIGLLAFPLTHALFPALADRGYSFSRALGLLVWGYAFWLLASLGVVQNDIGGVLFALALVAGLSGWLFWRRTRGTEQGPVGAQPGTGPERPESALDWIKSNRRLVITVEVIFLVAFAAFAFFRAANPDAFGTEKPMELTFIDGILKSPTFPPHDPWLSGYAISYYYFGYVIAAMIARLTGTAGTVAFNLILCLLFALSALGAYGLIYNLLAVYGRDRPRAGKKADRAERPSLGLPLLGPLFLLIVSNVVGFLAVLHRRGLLWTFSADGSARSSFWTWLDLRDLSQAPALPLRWVPDQFWWWWGASRVVRDYDLHHTFLEIIDEFPFFSYLLGDVHPHVLAMPFVLLAIGAVLNLFLGGWQGETNILGFLRPRISPLGFAFAGLIFGGLAFLNTWDFPIYLALLGGAYLLVRVREAGWAWARFGDLFELVIPLGIASVFLYLPFYAGFASQARGFLPNLVNPTRGTHLWIMFGTLLVPLLLYFIYLQWREGLRADWTSGLLVTGGLVASLWLLSWGAAAVASSTEAGQALLQSQGLPDLAALFKASLYLRDVAFGGLATLIVLIAASSGFILSATRKKDAAEPAPTPRAHTFVLLLVLVAALLVLAPEFVYLRDQFGTRINTVFKFYYQAWILWSMAAAFGSAVLFKNLRGGWAWAFGVGFALLMVVALTYPVLGAWNKANGFKPAGGYTLDAFKPLARFAPDEAAAIRWLEQAPPGILAEAADPGSSYRDFARLSEYSGLPAVLGWVGHERQWRGGETEMGTRLADIARLYETRNWDEAQAIIEEYGIKYIVVGNLERSHYQLSEQKFIDNLAEGFRQGNMVIYVVP
jgi:YYY domain-containing protein